MGKCHFKYSWVNDKRFKTWIKRHSKLTAMAICKICDNTEINIVSIGVSALLSHMDGQKHKGRENNYSLSALLFTKSTPTLDPELTSSSSAPDQGTPSTSSVPSATITSTTLGTESFKIYSKINEGSSCCSRWRNPLGFKGCDIPLVIPFVPRIKVCSIQCFRTVTLHQSSK